MGKKNSGLLDMHGYREEQVANAIDQFLRQAESKGLSQVRIMTGKGKGIVKKENLAYLKAAGYPWKYEKLSNGKDNEGVLIVFVD